MTIRKAKKEDSFKIAELMMLAMSDIIYSFINSDIHDEATAFIFSLVKEKGNQYSFENVWVMENEGEVIGSISVYDGGQLDELRKPVLSLLANKYNRIIQPQDETEAGEIYLDTLSVNPKYQGQGIGSKLLKHIIDELVIKEKKVLGLLVDFKNPSAKKLYTRLGFKVVGEKWLMGKQHEHMQLGPHIE